MLVLPVEKGGAKLEGEPRGKVPYIPDLPNHVRAALEAPTLDRSARRFIFENGATRFVMRDATWARRYLLPTQGERGAVLAEIRALSAEYGSLKKTIQKALDRSGRSVCQTKRRRCSPASSSLLIGDGYASWMLPLLNPSHPVRI